MEFVRVCALLGGGIAMGLGAIGSAVGEGFIAMKAVQMLGRQPNASGKIVRTMLIAQAVTETAAIFALVVSLVLIFKDSSGTAIKGFTYIAAGIAIGFGTIGSGFGAGLPGGAACEGIGKQPSNTDVLTINMLIGQAVSQTATIFSLTVALILVMIEPEFTLIKVCAILGAGISMGFGANGSGTGDGFVARNANLAIGRDPKNVGVLTRTMLIGQAVTEAPDISAMVVAMILIFAT
jgi:F-type H+-transporting ATPase subunit c